MAETKVNVKSNRESYTVYRNEVEFIGLICFDPSDKEFKFVPNIGYNFSSHELNYIAATVKNMN